MTNETDRMNEKNAAGNAADKPKKKNIIAVFRPQNSRSGGNVRPGKSVGGGRKPGQGKAPKEEVKAAPVAEEVKTAPVKEEVKAAPVKEEVKAAPVKEEIKAAPVKEEVKAAPVKEEVKAAPVKEEVKAAPAAEEIKAAPAKEEARPAAGSRPENGDRRGERRTDGRSDNRSRDGRREGGNGDRRNGNGERRQDGSGRSFGDRNGSTDRRAGQNGRTGGGQGTGRREGDNRNGQGRSFDGNRNGGGRGFGGQSGSRPGGGSRMAAPAPAKPFEKDGRVRNERGRNDRRSDKKQHEDKFDRLEGAASRKNGKQSNHNKAGRFIKPAPVVVEEEKIKSITIPDTITIKDLADKLKIAPAAIVKKLFMQGQMVTVNEEISFELAEEIAIEYEVICEKEIKVDVLEELLKDTEDPEEDLTPRAPVVCVMGHVDHGKTSLLDAIRNTRVTDREAGGITQHIGASVVECNGQKITFLDTPGHEAFTAMRMRGANSTDIAILVVAADDGVKPQTVEAINHAKAAGIEIIVAINKIDKPAANVERVKQELTEYELVAEDYGGSTICVPVSAKSHEGIETLLEMVLLTAEVLELKANAKRRARGLVIEARLDKGRGPVATVLVQKGILRVGEPVCAGSCYGKIRAMIDDQGRAVKEAGPSTPVEILGFSDVPGAGEVVISPETEKEARSFAETFISENRARMIEETKQKMSLDDLFSQIQAGNLKELNLIVKADVQGSVEAVKQSLLKLSNEEVVVKVIHSGAGAINESDVILASASKAIIIGFNVRPDAVAKSTAEHEGVDLRLYRVIYDAIQDVEAAMKGMLDPIFEERVMGHAEVRQTFKASGVGTIAGSYVLDGKFERGCQVRITRDGSLIFEGALASLKRFKDDVKEVKAGYECGLVFEKFNDLAEGDQIEAYSMVEVPRQ